MRVGIFTDTYVPQINGLVTSVLMLKQGLEELGHQVFIVTVNADEATYKEEQKGKIIRLPSIKTKFYDYRLSNLYSVKAINRIKEWDLDVIHSQQEFTVGIFAKIVSEQLRIPIVHTYHTMYEDYTHYINNGHFDNMTKKLFGHITKFYYETTATELIVPTKKAYKLFKEKYKFDKNIHIIPTGIDVTKFYKEQFNKEEINNLRNSLNLKEEDFVLINVSRIAKEKNFDFLINSTKDLVKKHKNIKLLVVGWGPDEEKYKKLCIKYKIDNNVIFVGKVAYENIPKYYQLADIFVSASKTETQGLTLIEAMGSSLPVIAIKDPAFEEFVIDGFNGYIFKTKKEYISKVDNLYNNEHEKLKIGNQARINSESYLPKYMAEKAIKVYKLAIGDKKKKKKSIIKRIKNKIKEGFRGY